jgi:hypothetical protein
MRGGWAEQLILDLEWELKEVPLAAKIRRTFKRNDYWPTSLRNRFTNVEKIAAVISMLSESRS